ncbi:MAG: polyhydroxyalkanoate synthesis repressor PhaR [Gammaproteobacteria bacterium]|nr:MAG: polyhydroxyalkanoate synthesis repressor PhaR [Gammaproteobacteria bacterium]
MSEQRIIKKYPNRRLYDTTLSKYITLSDVKELVMAHEDFQIIDAKSKEEITRTILLQIIIEQEEGGEPMLSTNTLEQLIRFYGDPVQGNVARYLEKTFVLLGEQRCEMKNKLSSVMVTDPVSMMSDMTKRNLKIWQDMQDGLFGAAASKAESKE